MKKEKIVAALKNDLGLKQNITSLEFNTKLKTYVGEERKIYKINFGEISTLLNFINNPSVTKLRDSFGLDNIRIINENGYLPLKRWEQRWDVPKKFQIKNNILYGFIQTKENIKHPTLWKQFPTKVYYIKNKRNEIWVKIINWNKKFIPKFRNNAHYKIIDAYLSLKVPDGYIGVASRSKDKLQFLLLQKMRINGFFLESLGLLWGEMGKSTKSNDRRTFSFSNKRPEIILHIIKFISLFGVNGNNLKVEIPTNEKYRSNKNKIRSFWSKTPGINGGELKIYFVDKKMAYPGACQIKHHSLLLKFLLLFTLNAILYKKLTKSDSTALLKGLLASEGSVILKYGKIENVSFENLDVKLIELFVRCLNVIGITWKSSYVKIFIQGWDNYLKIFRYGLLDLNDLDYYKFSYGFYNYKKIQDIITTKNIGKRRFTAKEFADKHNLRSTRNVIRRLRKLVNSGFLVMSGCGTKKSPYIFIITKKANNFFDDIIKIKKTIDKLELQYPEFKKYIESIEKRQLKNKFELKNCDLNFLNGLEINSWYSLKDIQHKIRYSRGHTNTVMPWLVRKGFAEKEKHGNKMFYKIIKTP